MILSGFVTIIDYKIVEYPISILIQSIILKCISYLHIESNKSDDGSPKLELNHKLHLIDALKEFMSPIQYILLKMRTQICINAIVQ